MKRHLEEHELQTIRQETGDMEERLKKCRANRDKVIQKRLKELSGETKQLEW